MLNHAGVGTYLRNLLPRVAARLDGWRFTVLVPQSEADGLIPGAGVVRCASDIYTIAEQVELPRAIPRGADLLWSPHYNIPLWARVPVVATVHDVTHLARNDRGGPVGLAQRLYARALLSRVRRQARAVMFVSEFSHGEFARYIGEPRRSVVVHNGVDERWRSVTRAAAPRMHDNPYLLFVGSVKPHKNIGGLLRAFAQLSARVPHDLLIVGGHSGMRTIDADALALARSDAHRERVHLVGSVGAEALRGYVAHADALVFPSLYEGFGLPPLEAMAAGCPCAVSNIPVVKEVCGEAAAYFDPTNASDMADTIELVLSDASVRATLVAAGRERAAQFTWDHSAELTARTLREAVQGR
jgi:glycosyltransferase involved in cell wall biosynthesis